VSSSIPLAPGGAQEAKLDLVVEALRRSGKVQLRVWGMSMLPSLWPGDVVTVKAATPEDVVLGDIGLVLRNKRCFIHRIVATKLSQDGQSFITRGDAMPDDDPSTADAELLGRVVAVRRANRIFVPGRRVSSTDSAIGWIACRSDVLRSLALKFHAVRLRAGSILVSARLGLFRKRFSVFEPLSTMTSAVTLPGHDRETLPIEIGGMTIALRCHDRLFLRHLAGRYAGFVGSRRLANFEFDIDLYEPSESPPAGDGLKVTVEKGDWLLQRGDFRARWTPNARRGYIRQAKNPYACDSLLRIVHTLILAKQGGFLVHAASAIRGSKAFIFSGVSGAGKTTISRLAPPDATLLTDEISYVRREGDRYLAFGTPFAGELGKVGKNQSAPIAGFFLLEKGSQNCIESLKPAEAVQRLLRNILFFAENPTFVELVFQAACEFASAVPIQRLVFFPDQRVWEPIC